MRAQVMRGEEVERLIKETCGGRAEHRQVHSTDHDSKGSTRVMSTVMRDAGRNVDQEKVALECVCVF